MKTALVSISPAAPDSLEAVLSLLGSVHLPTAGVKEQFEQFLVATDGAGKIIGCIGLERHAQIGFLRSLAVHPDYQGHKIGTRLTSALLANAEQQGMRDIVLLTTTAQAFFAQVFGFQVAKRQRYEAQLTDSVEWHLPRCSSAILMHLSLCQTQ